MALTGQDRRLGRQQDSINMLPALTGEPDDRRCATSWCSLPTSPPIWPFAKASGCISAREAAADSRAPSPASMPGAVHRGPLRRRHQQRHRERQNQEGCAACPALRPGSGCEPDAKSVQRVSRSGEGNEHAARNLRAAEAEAGPQERNKRLRRMGQPRRQRQRRVPGARPSTSSRASWNHGRWSRGNSGTSSATGTLLPQQGRVQQAGRLLPDHARNQRDGRKRIGSANRRDRLAALHSQRRRR